MQFWAQYGLFLAKAITIAGLFIGIMAIWARASLQKRTSHLEIKNLNDKYDETVETFNAKILGKKDFKKFIKDKKQLKKEIRESEKPTKRIFILNFQGDIKATAVSGLREEITAILNVATPQDEVFITIESGGGMMHTYGLAASQLARIRARNIRLVACVDKIAASGGYLMACVANNILAAPFAIIGSIGVLAQIPNFHRFLKKHNIDFEQITSGEFKRTLTLFGENTEKGRKKFQEELNEAHEIFKGFLETYRPALNIKKIATGEYWLGTRAKELELVDALITSDDYLLEANTNRHRIFEVTYCHKETLKDKLGTIIKAAMLRISSFI